MVITASKHNNQPLPAWTILTNKNRQSHFYLIRNKSVLTLSHIVLKPASCLTQHLQWPVGILSSNHFLLVLIEQLHCDLYYNETEEEEVTRLSLLKALIEHVSREALASFKFNTILDEMTLPDEHTNPNGTDNRTT